MTSIECVYEYSLHAHHSNNIVHKPDRTDGSIWKGDLRSGKGMVVISDVNGRAGGLDHDRRSGYLFVAGITGNARSFGAGRFDRAYQRSTVPLKQLRAFPNVAHIGHLDHTRPF